MNKAHLLDSQSFYSKPVNDDRRCPPPKYNVYNVILFWQMMNVSATFENVFLAFLTFLTFKFFFSDVLHGLYWPTGRFSIG